MLENVRGLLTHDGGSTWNAVLHELSSIPDYRVEWRLVSPKQFGVAHSRQRVYILGIRSTDNSSSVDWPDPVEKSLFWELLEISKVGGPGDQATLSVSAAGVLKSVTQ